MFRMEWIHWSLGLFLFSNGNCIYQGDMFRRWINRGNKSYPEIRNHIAWSLLMMKLTISEKNSNSHCFVDWFTGISWSLYYLSEAILPFRIFLNIGLENRNELGKEKELATYAKQKLLGDVQALGVRGLKYRQVISWKEFWQLSIWCWSLAIPQTIPSILQQSTLGQEDGEEIGRCSVCFIEYKWNERERERENEWVSVLRWVRETLCESE